MNKFEKIWDWLSNLLLPQSNDTLKVVVLCVITATTFWFFNALNDSYTTRISYPIEFTYPDSSLIAVEELPEKVTINVTSGGWNLLRKTFWFGIDPVQIPLENPVNQRFILGNSLYSLISDQLTEIQLNYVENDSLKIEIDSIRTKKAKLYVDSLEINLADNYIITSVINISNDSAVFTGPERYIKNVPDELKVVIEASDIAQSFSDEIYLPTFGSSLVNRKPVEVFVEFEVQRLIRQELMLPFEMKNLPRDSSAYIFSDSLANLKFRIAENEVGRYSLDSISVVVDFKSIQPTDSFTFPIIQKLPALLKDKDIQIDTVKFRYLEQ